MTRAEPVGNEPRQGRGEGVDRDVTSQPFTGLLETGREPDRAHGIAPAG